MEGIMRIAICLIGLVLSLPTYAGQWFNVALGGEIAFFYPSSTGSRFLQLTPIPEMPKYAYTDASRTFEQDCNWESGFTLNAAISAPFYSDTSLSASWTHFDANNKNSGEFNIDTFGTVASPPYVENIEFNALDPSGFWQSSSDFEYSTFDAVINHTWCLANAVQVTPFIGIRALWVSSSSTLTIEELAGQRYSLIQDRDYSSFGPIAGVRAELPPICHIVPFALLSGSVVSGKEEIEGTLAVDSTQPLSLEYYRVSKALEGKVGALLKIYLQNIELNWSLTFTHTSWDSQFPAIFYPDPGNRYSLSCVQGGVSLQF
jgi:hypothetical protein